MKLKISKYSILYEFIRYSGLELNLKKIIIYFSFLLLLFSLFIGLNFFVIRMNYHLIKEVLSDNLYGLAANHIVVALFAQFTTLGLYVIIYKGLLYFPMIHLFLNEDDLSYSTISTFYKYFNINGTKILSKVDFDQNQYLKNESDEKDFLRIKQLFKNYDKVLKIYSFIILNTVPLLFCFYFSFLFFLLKYNMLVYGIESITMTIFVLLIFLGFFYHKIKNRYIQHKDIVIAIFIFIFNMVLSFLFSSYVIHSDNIQKDIFGSFLSIVTQYFFLCEIFFKLEKIDFFKKDHIKLKLIILSIAIISSYIMYPSFYLITFPSLLIAIMIFKNMNNIYNKKWFKLNINLEVEVEDNIAKEIIKEIKK